MLLFRIRRLVLQRVPALDCDYKNARYLYRNKMQDNEERSVQRSENYGNESKLHKKLLKKLHVC